MVLAFGMTVVGCGGDDDDKDDGIPGGGTLTLTGIPSEYNGKYAVFMAPTTNGQIIGAKSLSGPTSGKAAKISGGSVTLTLWIATGETDIKAYTGADTVTGSQQNPIQIMIFASESASDSTQPVAGGSITGTITFASGSGTLALTSSNSHFEKPGGNDGETWSAVTSLAQLNGTWKGTYTEGPSPISDFFGAREDDGHGGGHEVDLTEMFGNMMVTIVSEMTATINATAKTLASTDKTIMTFTGGKINETGVWGKVKENLVGNSESEEGVTETVTYNDNAHSATITRVESAQSMEDEEIAMLTSGALQINQSGNKIKLPADMMGDGSPEVILSKQ